MHLTDVYVYWYKRNALLIAIIRLVLGMQTQCGRSVTYLISEVMESSMYLAWYMFNLCVAF